MARYPVSGSNTAAIAPATASSNQLIGPGITSGRVLWIRGIWTSQVATNGPILVMDATVGSTATGAKIALHCATIGDGANRNFWEFPEPGVKFSTNPVARLSASGAVNPGEIGYTGYES